ncbi:MAG: chemotaxis protein CheA [Syntrophus sp. (in: bacteria)]|nr:chemotaxis protein CheA [Syntrophus sp. (in: bacteria)]
MDTHKAAYQEEARELLVELESALLDLEGSPDDQELIGRVFRAMHTIKGSGAMFGFDDIAAFTHQIETVYDRVRQGEIPVTKELINLTLTAKDIIKGMLDEIPQGEAPEGLTPSEVVDAFKRLVAKDEAVTPPKPPSFAAQPEGASPPHSKTVTYRIRFAPEKEIFLGGTNPIMLLNELHSLGECRTVAQTDRIPLLEEINPEYCYTYWDIILTTDQGIDAIKDVFIFVEDQCDLKIEAIDGQTGVESGEDDKRLGEILVEKGDVSREDLQKTLEEKKPIGEMLINKGLTTPGKVESALVEQEHLRSIKEKAKAKDEPAASIRVPADKLDILVNLVGELVTVQARLSQTASLLHDPKVVSIAEEVERLTGELRDNTLNIRMLPIGTIFGRFKRLVRDLSQELGKEIELITEGAETELDKTVLERLNDPLVHLIRNSIDHGIEAPHIREAYYKPKMGTIRLSAAHSGAYVNVRIQDDGNGLDREAILAKAIEKGLVSPNADLTDKEVYNFIFAPGFSTAEKVTSVSGRGVGMDVVRKAIDSLRASIDITSEKGKGTVVTIKLPLTLAIVQGLLVNIENNCFVLPLSIVEECVELTREDIKQSHGRNLAHIRGELVPYIRLRKEFAIPGEQPDIEQIVVTNSNGDRIGLVVDSVIGEHQTVIKNLGKFYKDVKNISGATILGDGTVALIVDVEKITKSVELADKAFG